MRPAQSIEIPIEDTCPSLSLRLPSPRPDEDLTGFVLSRRYRLLRLLGRGGMGAVYLARHIALERQFALKVLSHRYCGEKHAIQRFIREARATSQLRHEHIVDVCDFGISDGRVYLVMEHLEGDDLAATLRRDGPLPWRRVARILLQVCAALQAAHARRIVHRDIKPSNCFRVADPLREDYVKVLDFGLAKVLGDGHHDGVALETEGQVVIGTPEYMAPESFSGAEIDGRVDIYAVGMLGFHLLTGKLPFSRSSPEFIQQVCAGVVRSPRQVVPRLRIPEIADAIMMRALRPLPAQRFQTISELGAAIGAAIEPSDSLALSSSRIAPVTMIDASIDDQISTLRRSGPPSSEQVASRTPAVPWRSTLVSSGAAAALVVALQRWLMTTPAEPPPPASAVLVAPAPQVTVSADAHDAVGERANGADEPVPASEKDVPLADPWIPVTATPPEDPLLPRQDEALKPAAAPPPALLPARNEAPKPTPRPRRKNVAAPVERLTTVPVEPETPAAPVPVPWGPEGLLPMRSDMLRPLAGEDKETIR
ncbi:serine/threonine-protein kinase [Nannocystis sp. SCPEA4]|uniref:serine/threonine protein kinase n=1 Tax=Nannocystis sp. SCPEA4 TaxID=2996787 RepID=UPI00226E1AFE|nr:serine/threonine-protein kinase [Nannocystis sp. SCPEA4]MCY1060181.1 serine/threonine-protein kinase [Nannocystis sp. SCPEA4]